MQSHLFTPEGRKHPGRFVKQKILVLLIVALIAACVSSDALAASGVATEGALDQAELRAAGEAADTPAANEIKDEGGPFEKIIAGFIEFPVKIVKALGNAVGMEHINILVFGRGDGLWHDHSLWKESEAGFIRKVYWAFASICMPFFLFVIISTGFKLIYGAANPGTREEAISSIWRWFAVMVMILAVPLITDLVLSLSGVLTDAIRIAFESLNLKNASLGDFSSEVFKGDIDVKTGSVIGTALVKVFFAFLWLWFNIIYFVRKIVLSVMICFAPIAGLFWAINKNVPAVAIWFGELGSNALMPVAHAIVLCVILGLTDLKNVSKDGSWFHVLIAMYLLMPLAETIRNSVQSLFTRWAGVDESGVATKATMAALGLGGLVSLGRLAGSLTGGSPARPPDSPSGMPEARPLGQPFPVDPGNTPGGAIASRSPGASPGAAAFAGIPGSFAGAPVSERVPGYEVTGSGLYVPSGAISHADGGGVAESFAFNGARGMRMGSILPPETAGGQVQKESQSGQEEKPLWGKIADGTVNAGAALAGGMAGWMVRAAAGAVPGTAPMGQKMGEVTSRTVGAVFRADAGSAVIGAKLLGELKEPRPSKSYFSGDLKKDFANTYKGVYNVGRGNMSVSDLMYANTLEEAVQSAQPKYSNRNKKLA